MEIKARDLIRLMEQWASPMLAEKWDNPGMQETRIGTAGKSGGFFG